MNEKRTKITIVFLAMLSLPQLACADTSRDYVTSGNDLYYASRYTEAIDQYDQAILESPTAFEPKFNKANSYYRLDDLSQAMDLYREVAAESKDMGLVARAKYNLGNSYFQQGAKQRDSNLQKAVDDLKTAIGSWRGTLDIEPENKKAARNIEVARLTIKDIMDQLNKQQQEQDPNQPQDPNQSQQQQQQQDQQQQGSQQDPNQPQDQQQQGSEQDPNEPQDPNQADQQQQEQQQEDKEKQEQKPAAPDTTAQEILDREQERQKNQQIMQRGQWRKVEKDW